MTFSINCFAPFILLAMLSAYNAHAVAEDKASTAPPPDYQGLRQQRKNHPPPEAVIAPAADDTASAPKTMDLSEVIALLHEQQRELDSQRELLDSQSLKIANLTRELDGLREKPPVESDHFVSKPDAEEELTPVTVLVATVDTEPDTPSAETEQNIETGNKVAQAQADDPTRESLKDFKGAWRLPGTDAALAIGGFVKTDIVYNFDPLKIKDRFITGSIPVGTDDTDGQLAQSSITANQSRLNFDLRQPTNYGIMRAFIEGDFADEDDTFRLRHAFGQWNRVLAGKTWTTFMDPAASPEEIDFEGLNGRINVRQSQVRYKPKFGEQYELQISMEDPNPEIQNGFGVTRTPDMVLAGRFEPNDRLHIKLALIGREIQGQNLAGAVEKKYAWGTSLSGRFRTPRLTDRDTIVFQASYGDGIGRYVNDLSSIGNYDGIFNEDTEELKLFKIFAGYVSWQHWWGVNQLRSNFTFGAVEVNNPSFVEGDAYKRTVRFSSNLIWSPIPRIDLGGEYLWGLRENEDGDNGDATQLQVAVKYRF